MNSLMSPDMSLDRLRTSVTAPSRPLHPHAHRRAMTCAEGFPIA